mmetsp:Transcript_19605/g.16748  ORF Transcript_19605/g.16748 Transcript_19605/m.16748 type:complete len:132 (-) Transcript_19605:122-517(-)|eukprot:CAMPEP_0114577866 /NCGR_PEP_ID=MMETSP0125-20121206/2470_1 /TAXON_ID=485358 ORGANISM="Aristerostoma sp., Strain ATCC 50986" /NCGR_SAMPLE_ID=MMETSP0125 /ASSEMBLY_ACC=CAM_ASM_000245 /LENGTH=131 /DNA_ID=CAMNT_0001767493 /DNA_START=191 /DNA_END=586 /DNA_ORIENTATION=+
MVIVGGGLIGTASAYELSKNPDYDIVIIERNGNLGHGTSFANGSWFSFGFVFVYTTREFLVDAIRAFFSFEAQSTTINPKIFLESNFVTWIWNYFRRSSSEMVALGTEKLARLGTGTRDEISELRKIRNLE